MLIPTRRSGIPTPLVVAALLALLTAVGVRAQGPRQDGLWEVKIETSMLGASLPPQTQTQCLTPEQVKDQQQTTLPGLPGGEGGCKIADYKTTGSRITWSLKCEGAVPLNGTGEFNYSGDTYTGTFKADVGGQPLTMTLIGKRLGDCKK
jgi:hypothetical protein